MTIVGVVKEVKDHENRVGLTPNNVADLVAQGHVVFVEKEAGAGAGFDDSDYVAAGGRLLLTSYAVASICDILVKVKEPIPSEYKLLEALENRTLITFLHLADNPGLAKKLLEHNITGVSYDTIEDNTGNLPILKPMSEIAGKFAVDFWNDKGAFRFHKNVLVVGGGITGEAAVRQAIAVGCSDIVVYEKNLKRAIQLEQVFHNDPVDVFVCEKRLSGLVAKADLVIGAVLVKGSKCPVVVTEEMIDIMKGGSLITDISIDQGGCIFGSRPTTHSDPVFVFRDLAYCCIPNMPGMVPREATESLTKATMPYILEMAKRGAFQYLVQEPRLLKGLNTHAGKITNLVVANDLGMQDKFANLSV